MTIIKICHRVSGSILFELECGSLKLCVEAAIKSGANLYGANLYGANLDGANLTRANLTRANLYGANLTRANLDGANLNGANLTRANLNGANLNGASLYGANLNGANLYGASLNGANLNGANLDPIRNDLWDVLLRAQPEVPGLLAALREGRVNGSTYEGECACLVGTIAKVRGVKYTDLDNLRPNGDRPIERFFLAIKKGDKPDTNPIVKIAADWCEEFMHLASTSSTDPAKSNMNKSSA